jgi:hypothetical protein
LSQPASKLFKKNPGENQLGKARLGQVLGLACIHVKTFSMDDGIYLSYDYSPNHVFLIKLG